MKKIEFENSPYLGKKQKLLLIMKLTFLLTVVCFLHTSATVYSQATKFSFEMKNQRIQDVLREIEKNSEFRFFYQREQVDVEKIVSLNAADKTVEEILPELFNSQKVVFDVRQDNLILIKPAQGAIESSTEFYAQQQQNSVSGKVTDSSGQPLPGVTVLVKGTTQGTVTNADGNYSISNIPENAVLQFSFVGMKKQEIVVGSQTNISVSMVDETIGLDEVVTIGYGTVRKRDLTGAVSSIKGDELKRIPVAGLDAALQGQLTGVNVTQTSGAPGSGISVQVRGISSVNAGSQPLYVIDGIPFYNSQSDQFVGNVGGTPLVAPQNPLNTINPADIQSIEVLKDASSTAIYGSRGANGVILITTKKGQAGSTKISLDASAGLQMLANNIDLMSAEQYTEVFYEAINNSYLNQVAGADINDINSVRLSKKAKRYHLLPDFSPWLSKGINTDWIDEITQTGLVQNYQLSITGGSEKIQFAYSGGYFDQEGIMLNSRFQRFSQRLNLDITAKKWLKFGTNLAPSYTISKSVQAEGNTAWGAAFQSALEMPPVFPVYEEDGSYFNPGKYFDIGGDMGSVKNTGVPPKIENPVLLLKENVNDLDRYRILSNTYFEVLFNKNFTIKSTFGVDFNAARSRRYVPTYSFKQASQSWRVGNGRIPINLTWINENILNYSKEWNSKHSLTILAGYTIQKNNGSSLEAETWYYTDDTNPYVDTNLATIRYAYDRRNEWSMLSYLGRVNYSYKDKYLITASFRSDGSSRFGENSKWGNFPSFALAWRLSDENFMKNINWLNNLKLRSSYGVTGNNEIGDYSHYAIVKSRSYNQYPLGLGLGATVGGISPTNFANKNLTWETTTQVDFGLDAGLFDGRLEFSFDIYNKKTDNLLYNVIIPDISGFNSALQNIGKIENKGWEVSIVSRNIQKRNIFWETKLSLSHNNNKVLSLSGAVGDRVFGSTAGGGSTNVTMIGYPIGSFWGYLSDGIYVNNQEVLDYPITAGGVSPSPGDRRYIDLDNNQILDDNDMTIIGNPLPDLSFGLTNNFKIGNFDASLFINGMYGNEVLNLTKRYFTRGRGDENGTVDYYNNRWKSESEPGDGNTTRAIYPTNQYANGRVASNLVEDGSFIRLSNLTLGYTVDKYKFEPIGVENIRFYLTIQNLYTFTKYSGFDPEVSANGVNPLSAGIDSGSYPIPRTFMLGLNINF